MSGWNLSINPRLGEAVFLLEAVFAVKVIQDVHDTAAIPIICDPSSVVYVTSRVL